MMKYLGIKLTRNKCKFYEENFKTLLRDIKEDLSKIKDIIYPARFNNKSIKMFILPEPIFKFKAISIKIPTGFFFSLIATLHQN